MNGLEEHSLDEKEAEQCLQDLLLESEEEFKHSRQEKPHTNPRLHRYYYQRVLATVQKDASSSSQTWSCEAAVDKNDMAALMDNVAKGKGDGVLQVDHKAAWTRTLSQLKGSKNKLLKIGDELDEIVSALGTKDGSAYAKVCQDLQKKIDILRGFLNTLRTKIHAWSRLDVTDKEVPEQTDATQLQGEANEHISVLSSLTKTWKPVCNL